ncbi:hypothetical protein Tco_0368389 [Tanacetum coccineum]
MANSWRAIMEEHRASMEAYKKVHNEIVRSGLRMEIVQQSMEITCGRSKKNFLRDGNKWLLELTKRKRGNPISPPVTTKVPATPIQNTLLFEVNSMQSFSSDKVEKEVKDIGFIGALVTGLEVADGYGGENLPQTDRYQSRVPEKDVPSHGPRKQQLDGLVFGAEVEIHIEFDLGTFEGIQCDIGRGQKRRTWNPGIIYHQPGSKWNILFQHFELLDERHAERAVQRKVWDPGVTHRDILAQHLEDKVFLGAGVLI